jgi:hypothetical protein
MKSVISSSTLLCFLLLCFTTVSAIESSKTDAAFVGEWTYEIKNTQIGDVQGGILFKSENNKLTGVLTGGDRSFTLNDIAIKGNVLTCSFEYDTNVILGMTLVSKGSELAGTIVVSEQEKYSFTVNKKK